MAAPDFSYINKNITLLSFPWNLDISLGERLDWSLLSEYRNLKEDWVGFKIWNEKNLKSSKMIRTVFPKYEDEANTNNNNLPNDPLADAFL